MSIYAILTITKEHETTNEPGLTREEKGSHKVRGEIVKLTKSR